MCRHVRGKHDNMSNIQAMYIVNVVYYEFDSSGIRAKYGTLAL